MFHEPAAKEEIDHSAGKKAKIGLILFFIYLTIYAGFVAIGLFSPELMGIKIFYGLNLAIVYGFGLIVLAVLMGFIYNMVCSSLEDKLNMINGEKK